MPSLPLPLSLTRSNVKHLVQRRGSVVDVVIFVDFSLLFNWLFVISGAKLLVWGMGPFSFWFKATLPASSPIRAFIYSLFPSHLNSCCSLDLPDPFPMLCLLLPTGSLSTLVLLTFWDRKIFAGKLFCAFKMSSTIFSLYLLEVSSTLLSTDMTTKNISRCYQVSLGDTISHRWEPLS